MIGIAELCKQARESDARMRKETRDNPGSITVDEIAAATGETRKHTGALLAAVLARLATSPEMAERRADIDEARAALLAGDNFTMAEIGGAADVPSGLIMMLLMVERGDVS